MSTMRRAMVTFLFKRKFDMLARILGYIRVYLRRRVLANMLYLSLITSATNAATDDRKMNWMCGARGFVLLLWCGEKVGSAKTWIAQSCIM
ncbi:unnamed protein product [Peronospora belbahrii]|uniref:Uncharacterized protein n=1 Tax=Peronospora belbahrii TaxID=622444 RepID=A0ABN8D4R8_9STRA|nr:unnamed protein product [Peronospora belbahrii]